MALALAAGVFATAGSAMADGGSDTVAITTAPALTWAFKQSWVRYVGPPADTSGGASIVNPGVADYNLAWTFDSGSYDPDTQTTVLHYDGTVHWTHYPETNPDGSLFLIPPTGYTGPLDIDLLDVTFANPTITISKDSSTITADVQSRQLSTFAMDDLGVVSVADLDVTSVTPTIDPVAGTTTWNGIPAFTTDNDRAVFAGQYGVGTPIDAVGFSYTGPGGAPDFSEDWAAPGSTGLTLAQSTIYDPTVSGSPNLSVYANHAVAWIDEANGIENWTYKNSDGTYSLQAFSLGSMSPVGQPLTGLTVAQWNSMTRSVDLYDTDQQRIYYHLSGESAGADWIEYDPAQGQYVQGTTPSGIPIAGTGLIWDSVHHRAFNVQNSSGRVLNTYTPQPDGTWTKQTYTLTGTTYTVATNGACLPHITSCPATVASDGALYLAATDGAARIVFNPDGTTVTETSITGAITATGGRTLLASGPDGSVVLLKPSASATADATIQDVTLVNGAPTAGPAVTLTALGMLPNFAAFAVDPVTGVAWVSGNTSQRIVAVKDDQIIGSQYFAQLQPVNFLVVNPDHGLYVQTDDGSPLILGSSQSYGVGTFTWNGFSPTVTAQPADATVALDAGHTAAAATFTAAATGTPDASVQWQVETPGASQFSDVSGATDPTLHVTATAADNGKRYRAVFSNTAGQLATDPATLTVDVAPALTQQPASTSVQAGGDAAFTVLPSGNPQPAVSWQQNPGSGWSDITGSTSGFTLHDDGSLTVADTSTAESGLQVRAVVSNGVGDPVDSDPATLTVRPAVTVPSGGTQLYGVDLDWTGNQVMQTAPPAGGSNYFSAGVSDGTQQTYQASAGNVAVLLRDANGATTPASYGTRASFVGGGGQSGQEVELSNGVAHLAADGSATVDWTGSWSVNFYGGLVPFTFTNPELTVNADGSAVLTADLSGYGSSRDDPTSKSPITPVPHVTVSTFQHVSLNPAGSTAITPDYAGVTVSGAAAAGAEPQNTTEPGWGSWPQSFVNVQFATGLSSYWYSSGGAADPDKPGSPVVVDFTGASTTAPAAVGTSTSLSASPDSPAPHGSTVTLTATVTPTAGSGTPTGSVEFDDGATSLGTATLGADGKATTTVTPADGSHSFTALFTPTASDPPAFTESVSPAVAYTITPGPTSPGVLTAPAPTITGKAKVGSTLTAHAGTWQPAPVAVTYQWYADGRAIGGATGSTYAEPAAAYGKTITVRVSGTKPGYRTVVRSSAATAKVAAGTLRAVRPTISGSARVGQRLTAHPGRWSAGTRFAYRWYANGTAVGTGRATLALTAAVRGKKITLTVTGTKPGYATASRRSRATKAVAR